MIELVSGERCKGCKYLCHRHQTCIERIISGEFVVTHFLAPEAFTVQTHIPVAEVVVDECIDQTAGTGRVIAIEFTTHTLDERVETGENPAVDFHEMILGSFQRRCLGIIAVDIGIEGKEAIRII